MRKSSESSENQDANRTADNEGQTHDVSDEKSDSTGSWARGTGSWVLAPRFQKMAWKNRQCVAGSGSLQAAPLRVMCKAMRGSLS
jgi:hypothetical protein